MSPRLPCCVHFVFLPGDISLLAQQPKAIHGTVNDSTGAVIQGATVELRSKGTKFIAVTDESGHFSFTTDSASGTLVVNFPGFSSFALDIKPHSSAENIAIVLTPAPNLQRLQGKS